MNQVTDSDSELPAAQRETTTETTESTQVNLTALRLQMIYRLVLTGVLGLVGIMALIIFMLWLLPGGLPTVATLTLSISGIAVTGTLVGTAVGYISGSIGKEQAERRAEKHLALLLENLQKSHDLDGASTLQSEWDKSAPDTNNAHKPIA